LKEGGDGPGRKKRLDHDFDAYDFLEEDGTYQYLISMRPVEEANECYHLLCRFGHFFTA